MSNNLNNPGTPRTPGRARGREFRPREPYTHRLRKILEEYPDGSQVLREILQNSDDAKSTEQVFILDHNTYPSDSLFEPDLENNYQRTSLKLDRYQGPALLAKNNTIFEERDFQSLLKLADSEKRDQFDKIGVMGVGFNSIYHITDSPSFITGDNYVILDPHEWYFGGGVQFDFVGEKLAESHPDQFAPFGMPCDKLYEGTVFRYPLRTEEDSIDSNISKKVYKSDEILEMFHKFYENESINCLLFLKYIERISFYELKEGATEPELLYEIKLENADKIRENRRLIVENIVPMMGLLKSRELKGNNQLDTLYIASFCRQTSVSKENSSWLILNYLDDLLETETYFQEKFRRNIGDYKFIPNVGLAVPLNDLRATGRLFCFLPLPISMPFLISVHGYFAVSNNRRSLWSAADNEDLAVDALASLKVSWNRYLFEIVLPKAWAKFLRELPLKIPKIRSDDIYKFWPIVRGDTSGSIGKFCKDLLQNVVENLDVEDRVFKGPPSSYDIGTVSEVPANLYDTHLFKESEFHWLSISNGYLEDEKVYNDLPKIIGTIGFPVISTSFNIIKALKDSRHKDFLKNFSPAIIRTYLNVNCDRWQDIPRNQILLLLEYVLDKNFDELEGFKMIPLADGTFGTLTKHSNSYVYIGPNDYIVNIVNVDELNTFENQKYKFIDKTIDGRLYKRLYDCVSTTEWNLNIKILNESAIVDMIKCSLKSEDADSEEIQILNHREWIYKLWDNLKYRNWDLTKFKDVHLIPTNRSTLRKLNTPKKIFSNENISINLRHIFEKFGGVFVEHEFDVGRISRWNKITSYIIKPDDIISVLGSFRADTSYPRNLSQTTLQTYEASTLANHLSNHLRLVNKVQIMNYIEVIKYLSIFFEVDHDSPISLLPENTNWYLLPRNEENTCGKIIYPRNMGKFLNTSSQNLSYILEDIIKITRLDSYVYWQKYVIPYLGSQQQAVIDKVVDSLFDRLPFLLDHDVNLKDVLGRTSFVPVGTYKMSQQQEMPARVKLVKPTELFDPEDMTVVGLFFEEEQVFPAGRYGIPRNKFSNKFFSNLKLLGMKSDLSSNDVISRIDTIIDRKQHSNIHEDLIRNEALKLLRYIDDNWDKLTVNNDQVFLNTLLETEWIPTVDASGNKYFSKPQDCCCQKDKDLVCLVVPILECKVKSKEFLKHFKWDTFPEVEKVLQQLELCYESRQPPNNLEKICSAIYEYMSKTLQANEEIFKSQLENKPWILREKKFYSADKVVFRLPSKFRDNVSIIVELPILYASKSKNLFKAMGVRDEIGVKDFILIIKNIVEENKKRRLSDDEMKNVVKEIVQVLEQIARLQQDNKREGKKPESLEGLLIPSTENEFINLDEIQFDDMGDRLDEEKRSEFKIAHQLMTLDIARELELQTLTGKIYGIKSGDIDWDIYEQDESLTTRIKNIISDYPLEKLFIEFLQNADDAGAKQFSVIIDERKKFKHDPSKNSLLSDEMEGWQGPAIWIYNDAEFTDIDFRALIKLGVGGKTRDDTKIGRFGIGFNCAFHVTDLPSIISGQNIAFLDPNAKFLTAQGYPPRRHRGTRFNFIDKELWKFTDQCYPYKVLFECFDFMKDCSFNEAVGFGKKTLFRLPLRTEELAEQSEISNRTIEIREILRRFSNVRGIKEMLFLRNIESCSLHHINEQQETRTIWEANIHMTDACRKIRSSVADTMQIYQLDIERIDNRTVSEMWLLCTGGNEGINSEFREFSRERRLRPRGGVATLLAKSDEKSLEELRAEPFSYPEFRGEIYSYLPMSIATNLGVHLNGNFSLSSARSNISQSENDFLQADCNDAKWNRFILNDVLPELHAKLLDHIALLKETKWRENRTEVIPHHLWPIKDNLNSYKSYGLNVIIKMCLREYKIFWTEASGGKFVSLKTARFLKGEDPIIANILADLGVLAVNLNEENFNQLEEAKTNSRNPNFKYTSIDGRLVCGECQRKKLMLPFKKENNNHDSLFKFLNFILKEKDKSTYRLLAGLPLVPLSNGSVGNFGEVHYIGEQEHLDLFPSIGPSKFVTVNLPKELAEIFTDDEFSEITHIKKFDALAILDLLVYELSFSDIEWEPNGDIVPYNRWLEKIWSILITDAEKLDFTILSSFPLLPMTEPSIMIVRPDITNPLLYDNEHILIPILVKLKVRFTNMKIFECANESLKQCIVQCTPINIINSLEQARHSSSSNMKELFESSDLSPSDYEMLRTFIKKELETLTGNQENFMDILMSLPIWPIHSDEKDMFIDAKSGILLPFKLPFFSFRRKTTFYKCDHETDFNTLTSLNAQTKSELEYLKEYLLPEFMDYSKPIDCPGYVPFLLKVLSLENSEIEQYLKQQRVIPNRSLEDFVSANELYDMNEPLFRSIFADSDKFLPSELQNDSVCLEALVRIGLNRQVNHNTYIKCTESLVSQIRNIKRGIVTIEKVKNRAKVLVRCLYENVDTLNFNEEQWNKILDTKFVPSETNLPSQLYHTSKETSGFESFRTLCSHKYKKVCWSKRPLFDENIEPITSFNQRYPNIGIPSTEDIIEHWFFIVDNINSWKSLECKEIKSVIKEIYEIMNECSQDENQKVLIGLKIKNNKRKLFLIGEDPFNVDNWEIGEKLIIGLHDKVEEYLKPYENLLELAGARKLNEIKSNVIIREHDQKDILFEALLNKLIIQSSNEYNDVIFIVGSEKEQIGASRYVLSAASPYFNTMFCGGFSESASKEVKTIELEDVRPEACRVFLQWLYGQSFEEATKSALRKKENFTDEQESYETYYLYFLVHLLKITDIYGADALKDNVEDTIIKSHVNVHNVCEILKWSKQSKAPQLINHCEQYIESNNNIILEQRLEYMNGEDEDEISEETEMVNTLLER